MSRDSAFALPSSFRYYDVGKVMFALRITAAFLQKLARLTAEIRVKEFKSFPPASFRRLEPFGHICLLLW